jgi:phosphatidylglycerophosphate synthase
VTNDYADATSDPMRRPARAVQLPGWHEPLDPLMVVLTIGRLVLIPFVILWLTSEPIACAAVLAVFICADIYDGVIGRQRGTDGPSRRALDSVVDRIAIDAVYIALTWRGFLPPELLVLMLARDVYCALQCARMRVRLVAIRADWMYKTLNLSLAGWVVAAPLVTADVRVGLAVLVLVYSVVVAADLTRAVRKVLDLPPNVCGVVISAGRLRTRTVGTQRFPASQRTSNALVGS